jgi:hypothetical protein
MKNEKDERELQELEQEFGELFSQTRQEPTAGQVAVMRQQAAAIGEKVGLTGWLHSLRWMGAGAAVTAAALLALALFQTPIETSGPLVASNDIRTADVYLSEGAGPTHLSSLLTVEESLADDYWFADENEWANATSFDLFYGPMPGDDPDEWDGVYDHLLAQNMADEFGL